jgi:hypothetical protein
MDQNLQSQRGTEELGLNNTNVSLYAYTAGIGIALVQTQAQNRQLDREKGEWPSLKSAGSADLLEGSFHLRACNSTPRRSV